MSNVLQPDSFLIDLRDTTRVEGAQYWLPKGDVLTVEIETYDQVIEEIKPLLARHWEEIAVYPDIPLDPDFSFYKKGNDAGLLVIYTARMNGRLIGYAIYVVKAGHPHYMGAGWALSDIILVVPEHRNAGVATALYDLIEPDLKARGVAVMHTTAKTAHPMLAFFLESRGHAMIETGHSKRL
jgi:GNAT superfamily N-acetyltransferase